MKPGFILYLNQKDIFNELSDQEAGILIKALYVYAETGQEVKLNKTLRIAFLQFKNTLDIDKERYESKCAKNKENIDNYWKSKKIRSNTIEYERIRTYTNINKNKNKNKNKNINTSISKDIDVCNQATPDNNSRASHDHTHTPPIFSEVIACFNNVGIKEDGFKVKRQFNFKNTKQNQMLITNLLDQGFTKEDIFDVIYLKYDQWIENSDKNKIDMSSYYRPGTVLGSKFEEYLQDARMKGIS